MINKADRPRTEPTRRARCGLARLGSDWLGSAWNLYCALLVGCNSMTATSRIRHWGARAHCNNLLSNALKFSAKKEEIKITIGQKEVTKGSTFFVQDNGVGFNMNYKEKLFQLFNRLHHHDDFEGAGVGLSIVKRIMERHNGKIWAEGAKEEGATFYLWFPIRNEE